MRQFTRWLLCQAIFAAVGVLITGAFAYVLLVRSQPWQRVATQDSRWGSSIEASLGIELPDTVWERPLNARRDAWSILFSFPQHDFERVATALNQEGLTLKEFKIMVESDDFSKIESHLVPPNEYNHGLIVRTLTHENARFKFYLTPACRVICVVEF